MRCTNLFSIFLFLLFTGCNKDKYETTPSLKFKDVNTTYLVPGSTLQFTLSFTDKEGDLTDSVYVEKYVPYCSASSFSGWHALPTFPLSKNQQGDLTVNFEYNGSGTYQNIAPQCQENDTAVFRFALKDKAQHISDTVSSPPVIIIYQ